MGDDGAPYEKAIEETAKATSNAIDLVREGARAVSQPIANIYGVLVGDHIAAARDRNLDAIARKTKKILHDRNIKEEVPVPEQIAIPALEAAQGETREEIQDLWSRLLANAMDPSRAENVRPEFIATVRSLQPVDLKILLCIDNFQKNSRGQTLTMQAIAECEKMRDSAVGISIDHLVKLGCVVMIGGGSYPTLTHYSRELMIAVAP